MFCWECLCLFSEVVRSPFRIKDGVYVVAFGEQRRKPGIVS